MLYIIFLYCLGGFHFILHLFLDLQNCLKHFPLLPRLPPIPSFKDAWLEIFPDQVSEICNMYLCSVIPAFLQKKQEICVPPFLGGLLMVFRAGIITALAFFLRETLRLLFLSYAIVAFCLEIFLSGKHTYSFWI